MNDTQPRSRALSPSRPSPTASATAAAWLHRAERSLGRHRQELLLLVGTAAFVVVVALMGVAALNA